MLSKIPTDLSKIKKEDKDRQILRLGMMAELDAISVYEQLAAETNSRKIKNALLDIAREEKTHVGEFETLLLQIDKEQVEESAAGKKEVNEF
ncbi:MAG TPA: ferritin family protein [Patescibacteria group bacterium]|nr:ferritin family protein [Patescibacteria group bacterium]